VGVHHHRDPLRFKTGVVVAIVVCASVAGNCLLSLGIRSGGQVQSFSPWEYLRAFADPVVASGVILLFVSMLSQSLLMSWADLSYVLPVTSFSYVMTALLGTLLLNDSVPPLHWAGIALITGGVGLVGRTMPATTEVRGTEW
jgi:drug/metabolite transporter (DMT)-like permease